MIGAIIGDIAGSVYEGNPIKTEDFPFFSAPSTFTDDTVLTVATAEALLENGNYGKSYLKWGKKYPHAGYGGKFKEWLTYEKSVRQAYPPPYNSWGNGAAMRVSPVAFAFDSLREVEIEAEISASVTHDHPEGIKGAKAVAATIFLARKDTAKNMVKDYLEVRFGYKLDKDYEQVKKYHQFDVSAAGSVPEAIVAFLAAENFEDAVRKAVALGGDADTQACIAGAIAHAYYKDIPKSMIEGMEQCITPEMSNVIRIFKRKFGINY